MPLLQELLRGYKSHIRDFMRNYYTDAKLVELLEHARSGKLMYYSCCCFIGIATAKHELRMECAYQTEPHYLRARDLFRAAEAETAYASLDLSVEGIGDLLRQRRLIPMIKSEIKRRMKEDANETLAIDCSIDRHADGAGPGTDAGAATHGADGLLHAR